ncbi:senescence-specific cysteine protease SAG39-like protein [Tanacetum coccineum]
MVRYGRAYRDSKERVMRFKIFKENVAYIEDFNSEHLAYKLSINKFADQKKEEFIATHTGFRVSSTLRLAQNMKFRFDSVTGIPSSMDWRQKGAVTPVKAQGQCGSCWVFSTIAATEGIIKIATGKRNSLSVQELMDCDKNSEDKGCDGGFSGSNRTCNTTKEVVHAATISGYEIVPANNESALLKAVAMQPVSVTFDTSNFRFYSSDWGEEGYFKIQRDIDAKEGCMASYPTV